MQTIAVTGGTGFLGRPLCAALLDNGFAVRCLTRSGSAPAGTVPVPGDLENTEALAALLGRADAVIHLAAATRGGNPERFQRVNEAGTWAVTLAATACGCRQIIYISSDLAALEGEPYGRSKRQAEQIVARSEMPWTILRFPALYGPGRENRACAAEKIANRIRRGKVFIPGSGQQRMSFLSVHDACQAILRALERPELRGKTYFVGPPAIALNDATDAIATGLGLPARKLHVPWGVARGMLRTALNVAGKLPFDVTTLLTIDQHKVLDGSAFENAVHWSPTDAVRGLQRFGASLAARWSPETAAHHT